MKHKITAPFDSEILRLPKAGTVTYQAVQNLLPDILLMLGTDASLSPFLNRRKPMLEGVHVTWRAAFTIQPCHFVSS